MVEATTVVEPMVNRDGTVWLPSGPNVEECIGTVEKNTIRGRTNKVGQRWFPACTRCHSPITFAGYQTRKRAVEALMSHRRPWFHKRATLTADGHAPFQHTSKSQSIDDDGAARLCAQVWMIGRPDRRAATNISVRVETIREERHP